MIIRTPRKQKFTIIDNDILDDNTLSFKAKGLLSYLLSKPDNWSINGKKLAKVGPDGETAIYSALEEIEKAGYLVRKQERNPDGTFVGKSFLYDYPVRENLDSDNPEAITNTDITNTNTTTKKVIEQEVRGEMIDVVAKVLYGAIPASTNKIAWRHIHRTATTLLDSGIEPKKVISWETRVWSNDFRSRDGRRPTPSWLVDGVAQYVATEERHVELVNEAHRGDYEDDTWEEIPYDFDV